MAVVISQRGDGYISGRASVIAWSVGQRRVAGARIVDSNPQGSKDRLFACPEIIACECNLFISLSLLVGAD